MRVFGTILWTGPGTYAGQSSGDKCHYVPCSDSRGNVTGLGTLHYYESVKEFREATGQAALTDADVMWKQ